MGYLGWGGVELGSVSQDYSCCLCKSHICAFRLAAGMRSHSGPVWDGGGDEGSGGAVGAGSNTSAPANISIVVVMSACGCHGDHITAVILPKAIIRCGVDPDHAPAPALRGNR